jgi:predicted transcriptional regulator with HTH domain
MGKEERKEAVADAMKHLENMRGKVFGVVIESVSRSGMQRKMKFYSGEFMPYTRYIATILDMRIDRDYNLIVKGCGMDMIFSVLSNLNYAVATIETGKTISELLKTKECGERIYDNYFIDANGYHQL